MRKRILVTGGAGFLGSHVCERLLARGDEVACLDDLSTGSRANVAHLEGNSRFTFVQHDVAIPLDPLELDEIYNLACPASPPLYQRDPVRTLKTSVWGALNMLELGALAGAKVLQASTSEVYGDPEVHPQPESYRGNVDPTGPRSCYDEGKRAAETLFFDFHRGRGIPIKVARIFNTYGPRMAPEDGRVVSNFIVQALRGEPLTVYGDGGQTRSFCYVDDLVDGMIRLMDSGDEVTGPVNLGNSAEFTVLELAQLVKAMVGTDVPIEHRPVPQDDPRRRKPDIALARRALDWEPSTPLAEGLKATIAYFRARLGGGASASGGGEES